MLRLPIGMGRAMRTTVSKAMRGNSAMENQISYHTSSFFFRTSVSSTLAMNRYPSSPLSSSIALFSSISDPDNASRNSKRGTTSSSSSSSSAQLCGDTDEGEPRVLIGPKPAPPWFKLISTALQQHGYMLIPLTMPLNFFSLGAFVVFFWTTAQLAPSLLPTATFATTFVLHRLLSRFTKFPVALAILPIYERAFPLLSKVPGHCLLSPPQDKLWNTASMQGVQGTWKGIADSMPYKDKIFNVMVSSRIGGILQVSVLAALIHHGIDVNVWLHSICALVGYDWSPKAEAVAEFTGIFGLSIWCNSLLAPLNFMLACDHGPTFAHWCIQLKKKFTHAHK